jgi:sugar O-acyltransferase (sialic acid O-acetyltransferase NeuD family)
VDNLRSRAPDLSLAMVDLEGRGRVGEVIGGVPVRWAHLQALETLDPSGCVVIVAHGDNELKLRVASTLAGRGFTFACAVHRQALVSPAARIEVGSIVNAGAVIMPQATIERHVIVHAGAVIEHDCIVEQGANIAPGVTLAGRVRVGRGAYVFTGSSVIPDVHVGARAIVGAGAVVLKSVPEGATVVGNPARMHSRAGTRGLMEPRRG